MQSNESTNVNLNENENSPQGDQTFPMEPVVSSNVAEVDGQSSEEVLAEESPLDENGQPSAEAGDESAGEASGEPEDGQSSVECEDCEFGLDELQLVKTLINKCAVKGSFELNEYKDVGVLVEKIDKILTSHSDDV